MGGGSVWPSACVCVPLGDTPHSTPPPGFTGRHCHPWSPPCQGSQPLITADMGRRDPAWAGGLSPTSGLCRAVLPAHTLAAAPVQAGDRQGVGAGGLLQSSPGHSCRRAEARGRPAAHAEAAAQGPCGTSHLESDDAYHSPSGVPTCGNTAQQPAPWVPMDTAVSMLCRGQGGKWQDRALAARLRDGT